MKNSCIQILTKLYQVSVAIVIITLLFIKQIIYKKIEKKNGQ